MEAERNRGVDSKQMMVADKATTPESAAPCSKQNNQAESTTPEPSPATCAFCGDDRDVYQIGDQWICTDHLAASVSIACDVWPTDISYSSYSSEFEAVLL